MADTNKINSFKEITVVAIALRRTHDHCYLLARRGPGQSGQGEWEFPGGKIESGETQKEALVREIKEELGILINQNKLKYLSDNVHAYPEKKVHLYLWEYQLDIDVNITLSEHDQIIWIHPTEMNRLNISQGDLPFVELLYSYSKK